MSPRTCLLCFSVVKVRDIKNTHLQNVYEELSGNKIQADSHPLCYICHARLLRCEELLTKIKENKDQTRPETTPLVKLCTNPCEDWLLPKNYVQIKFEPNIKEEYMEEEYLENRQGHCEDETVVEIVEDQHSPAGPQTQDDGKPHGSDGCSKEPSPPSLLKIQKPILHGIKPYNCDVCSKTFALSSYLKKHKLIHNVNKSYSCDVCNKTFTQSNYLKRHRLTHNIMPYNCDVCSKRFTQSSMLKKHKLIHGTIPYKCDVCHKIFFRIDHFKSHKLTHKNDQPYSCDICSKTFAKLYRLEEHKEMHIDGKFYTCNVCNKTYNHKRSLNRHVLTHNDVKPFKSGE